MWGWLYKRDERGASQRFETHGKAAWWAAATAAKGASLLFVLVVASLLFEVGWPGENLYVYVAFALLGWFLFSALLYLYYALSGGVMSREERRRKNLGP